MDECPCPFVDGSHEVGSSLPEDFSLIPSIEILFFAKMSGDRYLHTWILGPFVICA